MFEKSSDYELVRVYVHSFLLGRELAHGLGSSPVDRFAVARSRQFIHHLLGFRE
jgi:hypothetical protein